MIKMSAAVIAGVVLGTTAAMPPATKWAHEEFTNYTARIFGAAPKVCFVLPDAAAWGTPPYRIAPVVGPARADACAPFGFGYAESSLW
jgi:hypothetical protein